MTAATTPLRPQLLRVAAVWGTTVLATRTLERGASFVLGTSGAIAKLMDAPVKTMPVPFMGPPLLIDRRNDTAIAQMPW